MAAAALGDGDKIEMVNLPLMSSRLPALADGAVDVLVHEVTHTMERDVLESNTNVSFAFSAPYLYSGMKVAGLPFFVQECIEKNFQHIEECSELKVCVNAGGTHQRALKELIPERFIVPIEFLFSVHEFIDMFENGVCNTFAGTPYSMSEQMVRENGYDGEYAITERYFSKEPLSMVTKGDDPVFSDLVNSVLQALLVAEQHNIMQDTALTFPITDVFGDEYQDIFRNAIAFAGNFGEIYDRYLGEFMPRDTLNSINSGSSGLIFSHPLGLIVTERDGKPLGPRMQAILDRGILRCGVRPNNRLGFAAT